MALDPPALENATGGGTRELPYKTYEPNRPATSHPSQDFASSSVVGAVVRHKLWILAASALSLLLLGTSGYGIYSLLQRNRHFPFEEFSITQVTDNGKSIRAALSSDGRR